MRITGGHARGRVLRGKVPDGVRPTSSRVREALFSMVGQDLSGARVLDAFAGSGLLGFEAWSRGAEVVSVERRAPVARSVRDAARGLGADGAGWTLRVGDVRTVLPTLGRFDGVLADPPYADDAAAWVEALAPHVAQWLVLESAEGVAAPDGHGALVLDRQRAFGGTVLRVYRNREAA